MVTDSKLYQELSSLSQGSIGSVQTGNGFSVIDKYLHTERPITDELLTRMIEIDEEGGGIILLVGSAGDGKSHLLSKVKDVAKEWGTESFYNDATASCSPNKTAIETLRKGLIDFSDANLFSTTKKKILAINLGKLNAFIDDPEIKTIYGEISKAAAPLFDDDDSTPPINTSRVKIVEFSNKQIFELRPERNNGNIVESQFLSTILDKLILPSDSGKSNPFYTAYETDLANNISLKNPVILNYQMLMIPEIRRTIVLTVIEAIVRYKLAITPREYLDFIYSILIPKDITNYKEKDNFYEALLPTLLYCGGSNTISEAISRLDPMKYGNTQHDKDLSLLFTSNEIPVDFIPKIESGLLIPEFILKRTNLFYANNGRDVERTTKFLFRLKHILDYHSECATYINFVDILSGVFHGDTDKMMDAYNLVTETIPRHNGSYYKKADIIPLNIQGGKYKLFAHLQMDPIEPQYFFSADRPWEFYPRFKLQWEVQGKGNVSLMMDYALYSYLYDLSKGKLAVSYENEKNIEFSHFLRKLADISDCSKSLTVVKADSEDMTLRQSLTSVQLQ